MKASIPKSQPLRDAKLLIQLHEEDWYFKDDNSEDCYYNVDHFKSGCYFNNGNAGGSYFTVDIFEDGDYLNDGNEEDCYYRQQGANKTPALRWIYYVSLMIKAKLLLC